ncbi:MAG: hypothetical protein ACKV0T_24960, partial [Planctomycetales bacterium]
MPEVCPEPPSREEQVDEAIAEFLEAQEQGRPLDRRDWLARHPDLAEDLQEFLTDRADFRRLAAGMTPEALPGAVGEAVPVPGLRLGDFEVLGEIGRGGMGVVYEARQISLNRRVALKLLSSGWGVDSRAVVRFRRSTTVPTASTC